MAVMPTAEEVRSALRAVRDPELDQPITDLGFVASLEVMDDEVHVRLRLPTYFCAPNFAWMMVVDAREAVETVPGVARARVELVDHMAAEAINLGVDAGRSFADSFPGLADGDLEELRDTFRRKGLLARQQRLCQHLIATGVATPQSLTTLRVRDLPPGQDTDDYLQRRTELGIDASPGAPLLVDADGTPVPAEAAPAHLIGGRLTDVSIAGNAAFCRGMLATRYGLQRREGDDV